MKKRIMMIICALALVLAAFIPAAEVMADPEFVYAMAIQVAHAPDKTVYSVGESLDIKGLVVKGHYKYSDGSDKWVEIGNHECYFLDNDDQNVDKLQKAGDIKIRVIVDLPDDDGGIESFEDYFWVQVKEKSSSSSGSEPKFKTSSKLPDGTVGKEYSCTIEASGGANMAIGEYYNPGKENNVPNGLKITEGSKAKLSGTPTKAGTYKFYMCASNDYGEDYREFTITIKPAEDESKYPAKFVTDSKLPDAKVGEEYSVTIEAEGYGEIEITWDNEAPISHFVPDGLEFTDGRTATLSGVPTTPGSGAFTLKASNMYGQESRVFTITVLPADSDPDPDPDPIPQKKDNTMLFLLIFGIIIAVLVAVITVLAIKLSEKNRKPAKKKTEKKPEKEDSSISDENGQE
ncbi:MAG: Ig domain-containing protein [Eubacteriales bacterium]|nr:Ig domain-containing protein [Eubacteriales bacterium]